MITKNIVVKVDFNNILVNYVIDWIKTETIIMKFFWLVNVNKLTVNAYYKSNYSFKENVYIYNQYEAISYTCVVLNWKITISNWICIKLISFKKNLTMLIMPILSCQKWKVKSVDFLFWVNPNFIHKSVEVGVNLKHY